MDYTEIVCVLALGIIACFSAIVLGVEGKDIILAIGSGLVGYLTKGIKK